MIGMGIFDGYQFSDTPQGGLIDRIIAQLGVQGQYQPSQAAPIPLGGYQMPRVGEAAQFTPDPAALPVNAQPTQGQMPMQAPQESPGGFGAGLQGFLQNLHTGPIGALVGGIGSAMGMQGYKELVPILGEQRARLAMLNPEMGKALLSQALAGKQYQFTTAPDGTVIRTDAHAGTAEPVYQAGLKPTFGVVNEQDGVKTYGWIDPSRRTTTPIAPIEPRSDTVTGPDGQPIPIPPDVNRKEFIKKVTDANAKAATGDKTEVQSKSEKFGNKMELAEKNLKNIEDEGTGYLGRSAAGFPFIGGTMATNWMKSDKFQKYEQARNNFITALLRDESGAAIGTEEFNRYEKELFPQPGDGAAVIKQKREARRIAIEGMKKAAGPGYKSPTVATEVADPLGIR